jgi:asparagine synthase (glutamine-hydrolysing)
MCGIAGAWWAKGLAPEAQQQRAAKAFSALQYRGPDDEGLFRHQQGDAQLVMLHKRLSVIDLGSGGHQPKTSADGRHTLVFNGEIVNYQELRRELQSLGRVFHTVSDTEVLLQAWQQWGHSALPRLDGMFAFVVFDAEAQTLTCVRDAFGIKPLFYSHDGAQTGAALGSFVWGSTSAAVQSLRGQAPQLNWQRAYDYLVHADYDSTADTFIEGIWHLPAGHMLCVDLRRGTTNASQCWWKPNIAENTQLSFADAAEQVQERFLTSVRLQMRSDVPLGAALSGGIDSSAVVCAMRHVAPSAEINTFSFIAEPGPLSEEIWVDLVNAKVGAKAHKVQANGAQMLADLDHLLAAQGEPFGSTSIYAQYRVFQLAKQSGITVTLDGQGADEMLAGYIGYPGQRLHSLLETGHPLAALSFARQWGQWPGRSMAQALMHGASAMLPPALERTLRRAAGRNPTPNWLNAPLMEEAGVKLQLPWSNQTGDAKGRRVNAQLARALTERGLPGLLRHGDRNAMAFSVESRVPFLTLPLVELLLSLPEHYLISNSGETKSVFRAAMRGIVPDTILDRRDKIGFATPELQWLRQAAPVVRPWLQEASGIAFLKTGPLLQAFDAMIAGHTPFSWQAWRWVNFVRWHTRTFG